MPSYKPEYSESHALVVGISKYAKVGPLSNACNDANAVANALINLHGFPAANVTVLTDTAATRDAIRRSFLSFANGKVDIDARVMFFFAGHGYTIAGARKETGFLVPVDGDTADLSSLISWDDLTAGADIIDAKHVLFVLDACFSGLALTRKTIPLGSMRLLNDMLQRFARQVITAGKANEVVSDAGGSRAGHSIFTASILDAFDGFGRQPNDILTGNKLAAYVYEKVGQNARSKQTPHYGFIDGDGDFIFDVPDFAADESNDEKKGRDILIEVAPSATGSEENEMPGGIEETLKALIPDPKDRIKLDDFITRELRRALEKLAVENFPAQVDEKSKETLHERIKRLEDAVRDLMPVVMLLAKWGDERHQPIVETVMNRIAEAEKPSTGLVHLINMSWYPSLLLTYAGGISAIAASNYDVLRTIFYTQVHDEYRDTGKADPPLITALGYKTAQLHDVFKSFPGHDRHYAPRSEYLFRLLQPVTEDTLFLGRKYESCFDDFEIMFALSHAYASDSDWGPPGRFAWKQRSLRGQSPLDAMIARAEQQKNNWPPLKAGLFGGSVDRFLEIAKSYRESVAKLGWF